jgi:phage shock protein PspC (stress-responsive transcriptional regulator)
MSEHITHTPVVKRLERSSSRRILAGVAAGLGDYFDLNPAFFRIGFVVLTLLGGAGVLVYLAAVLVMPEQGKERSIAEQVLAERRDRPWPLVGLGLAGVALIVLISRATVWPAAGAGWLLVLAAGLAVVWASRREHRARRLARVLAGLALTAVVAAIVAVAVAFAWFGVSLGDGIGDRVSVPASAAAVKPSYRLGIGDLRLDLSNVGADQPERHVRASVGIGHLQVIVPAGVPVAVTARAKVGDVNVFHRHADGRNVRLHAGAGAPLVVDARVGAGQIDVVRAAG